MHLYLIGYRGSGKTTVAKELSHKLGLAYVDTDQWIAKQTGMLIRDIFEQQGEAAFREQECEAICHAAAQPSQIISLGGGAILRAENRLVIQKTGKAIWLIASPEELARRIEADLASSTQRPSLTGQSVLAEISSVLAVRRPLYEGVADWVISTEGASLMEITSQIAAWFSKI